MNDCTLSMRRLPLPPDPGRGWRLLDQGDVIQEGDEYMVYAGRESARTYDWLPEQPAHGLHHCDVGRTVGHAHDNWRESQQLVAWRRRLDDEPLPPTPAAPAARALFLEGVEMERQRQ